jgi:hypothetical protein
MDVESYELIAYYRSRDFAKDYSNLARRNPTIATAQLANILEQLNANLHHLGIPASETDLAIQREFAAGRRPLLYMVEFVREYADSIEHHWHPQP